ncbi:MAG: hypothetical protein ABMA14_06625 [Hyphomonadaceae bacterium]
MSEASENPRPRIMVWNRRFGGPLRESFPVNTNEEVDEFIDLLAAADQRMSGSSNSGGHSEGA